MPSVGNSPNPFIQDTLIYEGESVEERLQREREEARAKEVSDTIDEGLRRGLKDRQYREAAKILLLGRAESGQSASSPSDSRIFPLPT